MAIIYLTARYPKTLSASTPCGALYFAAELLTRSESIGEAAMWHDLPALRPFYIGHIFDWSSIGGI